jgi:hypothetical protein
MRTVFKYIVLLVAGIMLVSCEDDGSREASVYKTTLPFDIIELNSVFEVYLVQDTLHALEIVGDEDVVKHVTFQVEGGTLSVQNNSTAKWVNPAHNSLRLYLHSDLFHEIRPNETCSIRSVNAIGGDFFQIVMGSRPKLTEIDLTLDCDTFYYWNNFQCGGKVTLRGSTKYLEIYSFALVSVDALDLTTKYAIVKNNSKGDCEVTVSEQLSYAIRGRGNIYLHGSPAKIIRDEVTSSGRLIERP